MIHPGSLGSTTNLCCELHRAQWTPTKGRQQASRGAASRARPPGHLRELTPRGQPCVHHARAAAPQLLLLLLRFPSLPAAGKARRVWSATRREVSSAAAEANKHVPTAVALPKKPPHLGQPAGQQPPTTDSSTRTNNSGTRHALGGAGAEAGALGRLAVATVLDRPHAHNLGVDGGRHAVVDLAVDLGQRVACTWTWTWCGHTR